MLTAIGSIAYIEIISKKKYKNKLNTNLHLGVF